ncbi:RNA polymerase sigma factor [Cellulomonas soli]|uniref:RNA polymerase sigma factor n=1 Tax=Cellulomonas soli TaxID=931535 RepID=A0A512P964_9CELL|nr:sigma-70 family RNA polymerase sigma factor [Cellulomonas soli]NYI57964.1 RNA polymerase sigma factor (sigma-70 family) [Cellulomonas soli]GEP67747.1 RNA polymerase sigma factor [Cellulomonas soli]
MDVTDVDDPYRGWGTTALVAGALTGDEGAWNEIVRRHVPAVLAQIRQFRLAPEHAEDVAQTVWLNLLENLDRLRDPAALPGWISTTARHECIRMTNRNKRSVPVDPQTGSLDVGVHQDLDEGMDQVERYRALREGLAQLPDHQRELLLMLATDPPLSYQEISARLGIPIGSIGPTRGRGLARLRQTPAIKNYLAANAHAAFGEGGDSVLALD